MDDVISQLDCCQTEARYPRARSYVIMTSPKHVGTDGRLLAARRTLLRCRNSVDDEGEHGRERQRQRAGAGIPCNDDDSVVTTTPSDHEDARM